MGDQVPAVITRQTSINSVQTCSSASCSSEVLIAASRKMLLSDCLHIAVGYIGTFKWERIHSKLYEGVMIGQFLHKAIVINFDGRAFRCSLSPAVVSFQVPYSIRVLLCFISWRRPWERVCWILKQRFSRNSACFTCAAKCGFLTDGWSRQLVKV